MAEEGVDINGKQAALTEAYVVYDGELIGRIDIRDTLKPEVPAAIARLRTLGVKRAVMLTGDGESAAKQIATEAGVDEYHAGLLPQDKVEWLERELIALRGGKAKLAFVGDGINDAPALSRADVGVAMGALGSDAAIEAADVALMDDSPAKLAESIAISRKTLKIVKQNIIFALGVKFIVLVLGALGFASMWAAVFADVGVTVVAIGNSMRVMR
jgi:Cd2+/Zn2+-exporting ATPase